MGDRQPITTTSTTTSTAAAVDPASGGGRPAAQRGQLLSEAGSRQTVEEEVHGVVGVLQHVHQGPAQRQLRRVFSRRPGSPVSVADDEDDDGGGEEAEEAVDRQQHDGHAGDAAVTVERLAHVTRTSGHLAAWWRWRRRWT